MTECAYRIERDVLRAPDQMTQGCVPPTRVAAAALALVITACLGSGVLQAQTAHLSGMQTTAVSGLYDPSGVAVDAGGNLYIADAGSNRVVKMPWTGSGYGAQITVGSSLRLPSGVAVDAAGNVYIADSGNNRVVKAPWTGSGYGAQTTVGSGWSRPFGVAVDSSGNVYVADTNHLQVVKVAWTGSGYGAQTAVATGVQALGVAVDSSGNVYVADNSSTQLLKCPWTGSAYGAPPWTGSAWGTQTTLGSGWSQPAGVAVDGSGNVYVADMNNKRIVRLGLADPPSLDFGTVSMGSSAGPRNVTLTNIGSAALSFLVPPSGSNPSLPAGFSLGGGTDCPQVTSSSSGPGTLAAGASCTLAVMFSPPATGTSSGSLTLTDDNLRAARATQSIALTGAGILNATATAAGAVWVAFSAAPQAVTLTATVTGSGRTVNAGTVTFTVLKGSATVGSAVTSAAVANGAAGASYILPTGTAQGTYTIQAVYNPGWGFAASSDSSRSLTIGSGADFGDVQAGSAGDPLAIAFVFSSSTRLSTTIPYRVLTQGAAGLDFTASGGTCAAGATYNLGAGCTVKVIFTPKYAGARSGAVVLFDSSGNPAATAYLKGYGTGPQMVFGPGTQSAPGSGLPALRNLAVDAGGNIYLAAYSSQRVVKVPWTGSGYGAGITLVDADALILPTAVAIDGAGSVYISDGVAGVVKVPWTGSGYGARTTVASGFGSSPMSVAVDGGGNLYVAAGGRVVKVPWTGRGYDTAVTVSTALGDPDSLAVDGSSNVYAAAGQRVVKVPWTGSGYGAPVTLAGTSTNGSNFHPGRVAVDGSGNVYFTDSNAGHVARIPWTGSAYGPQTTVAGDLRNPEGVAVDGSGNVYVTGDGGVLKLNLDDPPSLHFETVAGSSGGTQTVTLANIGNSELNFAVPASGSNPSLPAAFALAGSTNCPQVTSPSSDAGTLAQGASCDLAVTLSATEIGIYSGSLTLTDNHLAAANATQTIALSGGVGYTTTTAASSTSASFSLQAQNVTLSATVTSGAGAVNTGTVTFTVLKESETVGSGVTSATVADGAASVSYPLPAGTPQGKYTIQAVYNLGLGFVGSFDSSHLLTIGSTDFGEVTAGSPSSALTVTFGFPSTTTLRATKPYQVLTQGATGLDFAAAGGGTCTAANTYPAGSSCTVKVIFTPRYAGSRYGAVVLFDSAGAAVAQAYLEGYGTGPQLVFGPATASAVGSGLPAPRSLAVDAGGNIYLAAYWDQRVVKVPWTGSGYGAQITLVDSDALMLPAGVAVDGAGNVYISDGLASVVKVPWKGTGYGARTTVADGFSNPRGVAVDGSGNVYVADTSNSRVVKVPWTGAGYGAQTTVVSNLGGAPSSVAVDGGGNVYLVDDGNQVIKVPWTGMGYGARVTLAGTSTNGSNFHPVGVAVDGSGNVYFADSGTGQLRRIPWTGSGYGAQTTVAGGLRDPGGIAVDGSGNVYVADGGALKLVLDNPPTTTFPTATTVGSVDSTDGPRTVTVTNIGNSALTFAGGGNPAYPAAFPVNTAETNLCSAGADLQQGASCHVSVNFKPARSGSNASSVVLTDNHLNQTNATQSIPFSGTGK
jgi:sugar lactone lactonase YvrE